MHDEQNACLVCREVIKPNARKCIHCNSFQNWRRFVSVSTTVLSLLVALVSVLSVGIPAVLTAMPKDTDIEASIIDVKKVAIKDSNSGEPKEQAMVTIFLTNRGKKPGAVGRIDGEATLAGSDSPRKFENMGFTDARQNLPADFDFAGTPEELPVAAPSGYPVIEAGQSKVIDVPLQGCQIVPATISLDIEVMSFDMKPQRRSVLWSEGVR